MIKFLESNRKYATALTLLIAIQIFIFSSIVFESSGTESSEINPSILYHFIIFFLFAFFLSISITGNKNIETKHFAIIFAISIIYAITDEIHQMFVPTRNPSIADLLTDNAGILSSMILYLVLNKKLANNF